MPNITEREQANREVEELIASGNYSVVDLSIFEKVEAIKIEELTKDHMEYTKELYDNYLKQLEELDKESRIKYLIALKSADIIDNQKLEKENSFLLSIYMQTMRDSAIDELIKIKGTNLTSDDIIKIHQMLLMGTSSSSLANKRYRDDNTKFVGHMEAGIKIVDYFPIQAKDIPTAMEKFTDNYNNFNHENFDIFIKPFISHGLMAGLQMFDDGNTRMGRLLQHYMIWNNTNQVSSKGIELPAIYATRAYYPHRGEYRSHIKNIAIKGDNESWNKWFNFNLNRIEDTLFLSEENLTQYRRIIKK